MKFKKALALLLTVVLVFSTLTTALTVSAAPSDETYDTFDELTLSDLGLNPGNFTNAINADHGVRYDAQSTSHSVVLKFKWESHNMDTDTYNGKSTAWYVALDGKYMHGRAGVWFRSDKIYFCYQYPDDINPIKFETITSGRHDVEFGRKLVTGGVNSGKYYMYVMIDGEIKASGYTDRYLTNYEDDAHNPVQMDNIIYIRGDGIENQRFASVSAAETYEAYDEITYDDLKMDGASLGGETALSGAKTFTFDSTSPSHSYTFKFRWTAGSPARFNLYPDANGAFPFSL
ncbi:MAG: hypothetical protein MJ132_06050, partial [Clostridia bacterium]|nr:hypothetical protein [Clostridia bacterium]